MLKRFFEVTLRAYIVTGLTVHLIISLNDAILLYNLIASN